MAEKITIETRVAAPLETVWAAWTTPEDIMAWNAASPDWHCPAATNDARTGGTFSATMAARNGSFSFDFAGVYDEVIDHQKIAYAMADGRRCEVFFAEKAGETEVVETFDPESENPLEMQKAGWQAILDNFKKHVERKQKGLKLLGFSVKIAAPRERVWQILWADETYRKWVSAFGEGGHAVGEWLEGSNMRFLGASGDAGMTSRIARRINGQQMTIEHLGEVKNGEEIFGQSWAGCLEEYFLTDAPDGCSLRMTIEAEETWAGYFEEKFPLALDSVRQLAEG